ncbi:MAG: flagellar filament capping protein FliD [Thermacetogeniaceae bacterium]|jgi:flagellar hook-associated protein 2|nr:flagellar filament capping protein FliD [Thermoanaerobacterales bacterium]NLN21975.1 flagellar filament capping protein FliD [Syntrophomonadaceae bacterium]HAF17742.1 flagellar cap protein [Peptococcaceae bacterium]
MAVINRISGLASGLDVDQIVKDLMRSYQMRIDKVKQNKQIWQWRQEDYRAINTSLLSLRNTVFDLRLQRTFLARKVSSSDENIVTVSVSSSSVPASYQVRVKQLATVATNCSAGRISKIDDPIDTSASLWSQRDKFLNDNFGWTEDNQFSFTINGEVFTFDGDTDSLDSVIAAINNNEKAGVWAFYDAGTDRIALSTVKTGNNREGAEIQVTGEFMTNVLQIDMANEKGGEDALFEINGLDGMTSHDNSYTVNGVTFSFKEADPEKTVFLTVENDIDAVVNSIKNFVDSYNKILEEINKKLNEPRYHDYAPLTEEQIQEGNLTDRQIDAWEDKARSGLLKGDPILGGVLADMRRALASIVRSVTGEVTVTNGFEQYTTIADRLSVIGITTGDYSERGKLHLDEGRLREALQSNPEAVMELFTRTRDAEGNEITDKSQQGIAVRLYDAVNNAMTRITGQAGSAGSLYDNSYISRMLRQFDERLDIMNDQYIRIEDRYYRQFTALEKAIAQMNTQSMWLTMQFTSFLQ